MVLMPARARNALTTFIHHPGARAIVAVATALLTAGPALAFDPPPFPRVAILSINPSQVPYYSDPTEQGNLARAAVTVLGDFPGFAPSGVTMFEVIQNIKQINPNELIFTYIKEDDVTLDATATWRDNYYKTINDNHWWLYPRWDANPPTTSPVGTGSNALIIDNTPSSTALPGSTGPDAVTWLTNYNVNEMYNQETHPATSGTFTPNIDGFYMDNVFASATISGDWTRSGSTEPAWGTTASKALRSGYVEYVQTVRPLMPGRYQIGNIGDWSWIPNGSGGYTTGGTVPPEYTNLFDGGVMEGYISNKPSAIESQGQFWAGMMDSYHKTMNALLEPKLGILNEWGPGSPASETDFATMRYGLTSTLMDDGYFSYTDQVNQYGGTPPWFDEFNVNLGAALGPPQTVPLANGVYRRDFENGIALVNPRNNNGGNPVTVPLETSYMKIKGTQDTATNNGATVNSVTLQNRDGIILLRTASATNTFGRTTISPTPSSGLAADYKRGSRFTLSQAGVVTSLSAYMDGNGGSSGFQSVRMVLYKDLNGVATAAKVVESSTTRIAAGMPAQWITLPTPETPVQPGNYWIVIQTGGNGAVARDYGDGSTFWYANSDTFSDGASDPFGSGSTGTTTLCVYASYLPGTLETFGRTSIATSTSAGMSSDYKRGSPFTLPDTGTLTSFSAYLDGNGGASGSQDVRMALYTDAGGVPGTLVAQSRTVTINAGTPGGWVRFIAPRTTLSPGTYWIVLHTGNVQGVARDYGDGSTSWYAAPDAFWDGASQQYGTGKPGTTTLSVYVSYVH